MANLGRVAISGIALAIASVPALAVEAGLGRSLPGVWIEPQGAVVGPKQGLASLAMPIGYMGTIGGARLVPIGGSIFSNVGANSSTNYLVPQYFYKTKTKKVSLSSSFMGVVNVM